MNGVSIIICCYNSAIRLPETIRFIFNLNLVNSNVELIIVDNASKDETSNIAKREIAKQNLEIPYSIIYEDKPGLNFARKRGAEHAKFEWLLFCDDDNWLDSNYIQNFQLNLLKFPKLSIVGCGVSAAYYEEQPEQWFYKLQYLCAIFDLSKENKETVISNNISEETYICGAGMFIKKSVILEYYENEIFILTDRVGSTLSSGGDTDITLYALRNNYSVGQFTNLRIQHYIPKFRTSKKYLLKLLEGITFSFALLDYKYKQILENPSFRSFFLDYCNNLAHLNFFICKIVYRRYSGKKKAYQFLTNIKPL